MRTLCNILLLCLPLLASAQRGHLYNKGVLYISEDALLTTKANFVNKATGVYTNDGEVLLRGNFFNDGDARFTPGLNGYTRFQGLDGPQEIGGLISSDFNHVLFDNAVDAYSFYLSGSMYVFGEADFQQGIIDNLSYGGQITFEEDATHRNTSDRSYVNGKVYKFGNNSFVFPIGKEEMYRPGGVIQLGDISTSYVAEYQVFNSNSQYPYDQHADNILEINAQEYWKIEEATASGEVLVHLTWDDRTTPFRLLQDFESLAILTWDPLAMQWISLGGSVDNNENRVTSIAKAQGYDVFTLGTIRFIPDDEDVLIYNAINPNDPGGNDYFRIIGIDNFPENRVRIFNRWGTLVFDVRGYDTNNNVFRGISEGRITIKKGDELPIGTYFYIFDYVVPETGKSKSKQGYLYLNR
ncbi:MAG TPA: gliding motility-associated C-terminal domain-containing protein [Candidatus Sphingobacterium stercoripullorum]|nr:gliding motility-associated C-terminal domain-containing protein [Candidatus Sphingobacterium stercoripullorum]HLS11303.1 gliding motility-associated C-terminal domain-containing protein [Flavobacteriaceae bacterium]